MLFTKTELKDVYVIGPDIFEDERGLLGLVFSGREFEARGLPGCNVENITSYNTRRGTIRGLHYQLEPYSQAKLVRCTRGSIFDVAVDLRPESPTYKRWVGIELSAANRCLMFVPKGMAHGYQTLEDNTEVFYQVSDYYLPEANRGCRWNDPGFGIKWPSPDEYFINERDANFPDFTA